MRSRPATLARSSSPRRISPGTTAPRRSRCVRCRSSPDAALADATQALAASGFRVGTVTRVAVRRPGRHGHRTGGRRGAAARNCDRPHRVGRACRVRSAVQAARARPGAVPARAARDDRRVRRGDRRGNDDGRAARLPRAPARLLARDADRRPEPPAAAAPGCGSQGAHSPARDVLARLVGAGDGARRAVERPQARAHGLPPAWPLPTWPVRGRVAGGARAPTGGAG